MLLRLSLVFSVIVVALARDAVQEDPGREKKLAAVHKAIELMETLRSAVLNEGEEEAKTYDKFACFCQATTTDRIASIQKGEDEKIELKADINQLALNRDGLDTAIKGLVGDIAGLEDDIKLAKKNRRSTLREYEVNEADLRVALEGLAGAIRTMSHSKVPSLIELESVSDTVRTAAALADALGLSSQKTSKFVTLLLQQPANEVRMEDYKYHSNDIIETLEKLQKDFTKVRNQVDDDEVASVKAFDKQFQDLTYDVKTKNGELNRKQQKRSEKIEQIAMKSGELSTVEAVLLEDKEYTNKLSKMCTNKAKTWDQRKNIRANELATLTEAIGIVSGAVKQNVDRTTIRFAQQATSVRFAKIVAASPGAMNAIEAAAEDADAAPALLQVGSEQRGMLRASARRYSAALAGDGREAIAKLLRGSGEQLKSTLLTALASRIAADPFAKVKQLISELIERLLKEASNEANQKGWCDKSTADARQKRDYAAEEIADVNSQMANFEAIRDQLAEDLDNLEKDISKLIAVRSDTTRERNQESTQNGETVDEAERGLSALNLCINLLDKFYKTIKKEKVDLAALQEQGPSDDAPDAGFSIGEAYTGAQSEAGGILGMLDVMKSDFVRTVDMTKRAEAQAAKDHLEFMTVSGSTLAEKQEAESQKKEQKSDVVGKFDDAKQKLGDQQNILINSIKELMDLKPTCIDTGMSYNDRVSRRQEEIESLNKALCIFGKYEKYGPDGASSYC